MIPSKYLEPCAHELPELTDGSELAIQENRKETQRAYFKCVDKDDALIQELTKQGVKGTK